MKSKVNMSEIASMFNVSKVTVSKALNDKEGVSDSLRKEIKEAARKLGYSINASARGLKTGNTYNIGILVSERFYGESTSYYFELYAKLVTELTSLGYSGILEILTYANEDNLVLPNIYVNSKIDALIVLGQLKRDYLKQFEDFDIPVVFFDFYDNDINIDSIIADNFHSGFNITKELIKLGHKDIGFVGQLTSTSSIKDRFLGFYRALLEYDIPINYDYIIDDRDSEGKLVTPVLPKKLPTAFVCNNDQTGAMMVKALQDKGIRVPDDISLACFDNSIYSTLSTPSLTTIDTNVDELVKVVTKVILKKITNPLKVYGRVLVRSSIIFRDSIKERKNEND